MRGRSTAGIATAAAAVAALLVAPAASAAVEAGDDCAANSASGAYTLVPENRTPGTTILPLAAPIGGVVTRWKVNSTLPEPMPAAMGVYRPTASTGKFLVVGETNEEMVIQGASAFPTRIPVEPGDRFGAAAVLSTIFCGTTSSEDQTWSLNGSAGVGSTHQFAAGVEVRVPVVATIEPDVDGDRFGDETQDRCPQSVTTQSPCPPLTLSAFAIPGRRAITVLVSASVAAQIRVSGLTAAVPALRRRARRSAPTRIGLTAVTHLVHPGEITKYRLSFPSKLRSLLAARPPEGTLKLRITAQGANVAGAVATERLTVKLRGRNRRP